MSQREIEANPKKVRAILEISSSKTIKEVQSLMGRVAALNKFISKATDKCPPFFKTLKQAFVWTDKCEVVFQELKPYLSNPSTPESIQRGRRLVPPPGSIHNYSERNPDQKIG